MTTEQKARPSIGDRWEAFHSKHPEVYREFVRRAFALRGAGAKRGSAAMIFEAMRYESQLAGRDLVLNNDFRAAYARHAMANHPEIEGWFAIRQVGGRRQVTTPKHGQKPRR